MRKTKLFLLVTTLSAGLLLGACGGPAETDPTPSDPTPSDPTPSDPTPSDPTPSDPEGPSTPTDVTVLNITFGVGLNFFEEGAHGYIHAWHMLSETESADDIYE